MGFQGWNYEFDGPYLRPDLLKSKPGVYIIWGVVSGVWNILDVGESENVRDFLASTETPAMPPDKAPIKRYFSSAYIPGVEERNRLVNTIKNRASDPFGQGKTS
jgi:hypothetical protein